MDIDTTILGLIALIIRIIGTVLFIIVLINQLMLRLRAGHDELDGFRDLLIILTSIPLLFNFVSIYNNFSRIGAIEQNEVVNSIVIILSAVASTSTALVLWLIYRKR